MSALHPALAAFLEHVRPEATLGEIRVRRMQAGFEIRHRSDASTGEDDLRDLAVEELRSLTLHNARGQFRPLRSSPDLVSGWRLRVTTPTGLREALDILYPGGLGDWHTTREPVSYRQHTERQSGMYRVTALLAPEAVEQTVAACCAASQCLKRRIWQAVEGEPVEAGPKAPHLVCREPCALLLELARRRFRLDRGPQVTVTLPEEEVAVLLRSLEALAAAPPPDLRVADFARADTPRRLLLVRERLRTRIRRPSPRERAAALHQ